MTKLVRTGKWKRNQEVFSMVLGLESLCARRWILRCDWFDVDDVGFTGVDVLPEKTTIVISAGGPDHVVIVGPVTHASFVMHAPSCQFGGSVTPPFCSSSE